MERLHTLKNFFYTLFGEFAPLTICFLVFLTVNHVFSFKIGFLIQPAYGYTFSGRLMSVIQASFSMLFGERGTPSPVFLQYGFLLSLLAMANSLIDRITLFIIWFSFGFASMAASGKPSSTFYSTSLFLFSMLTIFLWGISKKYWYVWMYLDIFYLNPVLAFFSEYIAILLTLGLSCLAAKKVMPRKKGEESKPVQIELVCPRCGASFKSQPEYCSICGYHIRKRKSMEEEDGGFPHRI